MHKKDPPAFQEFAANMMATRQFRAMSLAQKGMLYQMRLECWVNRTLPSDPDLLARFIGHNPDEVRAALPAVMHFFSVAGDDIFSPELDGYRAKLAEKSSKQSAGGSKAMKKRWPAAKPDG